MRLSRFFGGLILIVTISTTAVAEDRVFTNLQVLDPDISDQDLSQLMLRNLRGLGLPRRQSQGCLYCHVGSMDIPSDDWNFASDEKITKRKARVMMAMVKDINESHLGSLEQRLDSDYEITCFSCHKGRTDPRPIETVLRTTYDSAGVDVTVDRFKDIKSRYEDAGVYDLRSDVLSGFAWELASEGNWSDAITIATANVEVNPDDVSAEQVLLSVEVWRRVSEQGTDSALAYFDTARQQSVSADHSILDGVAWTLDRSGQPDKALQLFKHNLQKFPDEYIPNESLGDLLWFSGDRAGGIVYFEKWVAAHPDHEMGRRRLLNMQADMQ